MEGSWLPWLKTARKATTWPRHSDHPGIGTRVNLKCSWLTILPRSVWSSFIWLWSDSALSSKIVTTQLRRQAGYWHHPITPTTTATESIVSSSYLSPMGQSSTFMWMTLKSRVATNVGTTLSRSEMESLEIPLWLASSAPPTLLQIWFSHLRTTCG